MQTVGRPGHPTRLGHGPEESQVGELDVTFSWRDRIVHDYSFYEKAGRRQAPSESLDSRRCPMSLQTVLTRRLGLQHPIIQAPLAGGGDTPDLVAAVAEAGALGFIGAAYLTPPQIAEAARAVRARTARPFGINLFAPLPAAAAPSDLRPALERVAPFYAELGLAPPEIPASATGTFDKQFEAALASGASAFSFTFGMLPASAREAVQARGMFLIGTATTVDEAVALEKAGVDAIVTQGSEA